MGKQFGQASRLAAVIIVAAAFGCSNAVAVEFADIAGTWCTTGGSEEFECDNLIAIPTASRERRVYPIVSYKFGDTQVTVIWKNAKIAPPAGPDSRNRTGTDSATPGAASPPDDCIRRKRPRNPRASSAFTRRLI